MRVVRENSCADMSTLGGVNNQSSTSIAEMAMQEAYLLVAEHTTAVVRKAYTKQPGAAH
jgi:hypothetical protein